MLIHSDYLYTDFNEDEIYSLKPTENVFEKNKSDLISSNLLQKTEANREKHPTLETDVEPNKTTIIYKGIFLIVLIIITLSLTRQFL